MSVYHWCIFKKIVFVFGDCWYFILLIVDTYNNHVTCTKKNIYIYIIHTWLFMWTISGWLSLILRVVPKLSFPQQIQSHLKLSKADNEGNSQSEAFKNLTSRRYRDHGPKCGKKPPGDIKQMLNVHDVFFNSPSVLYKFESLATALSGFFRLAAVWFKYSDAKWNADFATGWSKRFFPGKNQERCWRETTSKCQS